MKIAILSDIHENLHNLKIVLNQIKDLDIKEAIFLGDYINPGLTKQFFSFCSENNIKLNAIFGNNDGDKGRILLFANENNINHSYYDFAEWEIDNKKIFAHHFDSIGMSIDKNKFDLVLFGHNHEHYIDVSDPKHIVANPGEISSHITGTCSYMIWDTTLNKIELIKLESNIIYNPYL
jgi:putative phosphoesterase